MTFEHDIRAGHLEVEAFADGHALRARALLERLPIYLWGPGMPLRLAIAQTIGVEVLATADHGRA
jgi:hypothetical protein